MSSFIEDEIDFVLLKYCPTTVRMLKFFGEYRLGNAADLDLEKVRGQINLEPAKNCGFHKNEKKNHEVKCVDVVKHLMYGCIFGKKESGTFERSIN